MPTCPRSSGRSRRSVHLSYSLSPGLKKNLLVSLPKKKIYNNIAVDIFYIYLVGQFLSLYLMILFSSYCILSYLPIFMIPKSFCHLDILSKARISILVIRHFNLSYYPFAIKPVLRIRIDCIRIQIRIHKI